MILIDVDILLMILLDAGILLMILYITLQVDIPFSDFCFLRCALCCRSDH